MGEVNFKQIAPLLLILLIIGVTLAIVGPVVNNSFEGVYSFLSTIDVNSVRQFIYSFGIVAPLIFLILQVVQAVIAPIPGFVFTIAGGLIFHPLIGILLSIVGSMIGAAICFLISKKYGRPFIIKISKKEDLGYLDELFEENGALVTAIFRAIPVMSFGLASYLIALTKIDFKEYMWGTFIGLIPTTFFYTYLGYYLLDNPLLSAFVGLLLLAFFIAMPLIFPFIKGYIKRKKEKRNKVIF